MSLLKCCWIVFQHLRGAEKVQVSLEDCLMIENAPFGIKSAKSAKMKCIAVCSTLKPIDLSGADLVLSNLNAVHNLLKLEGRKISVTF